MNLLFLEAVSLFAPSPHFGREQGKATQDFILNHGLILVSRCSCQTLNWLFQTPSLGNRLVCILSCQLCIQSKGTIWLLECGPAPFQMAINGYVQEGTAMKAGTKQALWEIWAVLDRQLEVGISPEPVYSTGSLRPGKRPPEVP